MATIVIDELDGDGNPEQHVEKQQNTEQQTTQPQDTQQSASADDGLPEKFKGKSAADIAKMYGDLEHVVGRQGAELGELRRLSDEFLRSTLKEKSNESKADSQTTESTNDDTEFFINPRKAIKKLLQEDPEFKSLKGAVEETVQERNSRIFKEKHPDADTILKDGEFREWVQKSRVRTGLLLRAHQHFDVEAGDELFSTWKEIKGAKAPQQTDQQPNTTQEADKAAADAARRDAVRAGTVPSGNAAGSKGDGKKYYRRADLIKLQINDPEKYAAMGEEILAAYAENRVI